MNIEIININHDPHRTSMYVGRTKRHVGHFGNPFTHVKSKYTLATVVVGSRREAIQAFSDWLDGTKYQNIEPVRRLWILARITELATEGKDLVLSCFCAPDPCHAEIIRDRILEARKKVG